MNKTIKPSQDKTVEKYQITKKECEATIKGVCEGCGGKLQALRTVDNSGNPTHWVGCRKCSCFRSGVDKRYWEIARKLIEDNTMIPYPHMNRHEYEEDPERLEYWFSEQCASLSRNIRYIHNLIKEYYE